MTVRRTAAFAFIAFLAVSASACGEFDESGESPLGGAAQAATARYVYDCTNLGNATRYADQWARMTLTLQGNLAKTVAGEIKRTHTFDPNYRPRGSNAGYARYSLDLGGGTAAVLVQTELRTGGYALRSAGRGGYAKYQVTFDGFGSQTFICRRR